MNACEDSKNMPIGISRCIWLIGIVLYISTSSPASALEREWVHEICRQSDQPELCGVPEGSFSEDEQRSLDQDMADLRQRAEAMFYHAVRDVPSARSPDRVSHLEGK
jgi:hypothetical protein